MVDNERENLHGSLIVCGNCQHALGFLCVVRSLSIKTSAVLGEESEIAKDSDFPKTMPFSPVYLLNEQPVEAQKSSWDEGHRVDEWTPEQQQEMSENQRLLSMTGDIQAGEEEWSLAFAPRFDIVDEQTYAEKEGPLSEYSRFRVRLAMFQWLIDATKNEVRLYKKGLETPENLPYPDLVEQGLKRLQERLVELLSDYKKMEASGNVIPTSLCQVDSSITDFSKEITVVCPQCDSHNLLVLPVTSEEEEITQRS